MTCNLLKNTLYPKDKKQKYSTKFVKDLIVDHIPSCDRCYAFYQSWYSEYHFGNFWKLVEASE